MNVKKCPFLQCFSKDFSKTMTFSEAKKKAEPHVYLFISPHKCKYQNGHSQIAYIGYTDNPKSRFASHHRRERGDKVMMLPLSTLLRAVKENYHDWRRTSAADKRRTAENMERVLLYLFKRLMGSLPERNVRKDLPRKHDVAVLAEFILDSRTSGTITYSSKAKAAKKSTTKRASSRKSAPKADLSSGKKIASALVKQVPSKFSKPRQRDANDRRIIVHECIHIMRIRICEGHCRVQVRSKRAFAGRSRSAKVTSKAWHQEWHRVDSQRSIDKVVDLLVKEWC